MGDSAGRRGRTGAGGREGIGERHRRGSRSGHGNMRGAALDVLPNDPAIGAGSGDVGKLQAHFLGHALGQWRSQHAATHGHGTGAGGWGPGLLPGQSAPAAALMGACGTGCRRVAAGSCTGRAVGFDQRRDVLVGLANHRQQFADGHHLVDRHQDLAEHAAAHGFHFHVHFIGFDFDDGVAGGNGVAFLLEPLQNLALRHRIAALGHHYLNGHREPLIRYWKLEDRTRDRMNSKTESSDIGCSKLETRS